MLQAGQAAAPESDRAKVRALSCAGMLFRTKLRTDENDMMRNESHLCVSLAGVTSWYALTGEYILLRVVGGAR